MENQDSEELERDRKFKEFEGLANPLIKFLNDNFHPNMVIVIGTTSAVLSEDLMAHHTDYFIKD